MHEATRFCVLRHGETDWNASRRIQGQIDTELNERGRAQAQRAAAAVQGEAFALVLSSDLQRASATAAIVAAGRGAPIHLTPALRERHHGFFQGLSWDDVPTQHAQAYARFLAREPDYALETGESLASVVERVFACLDSYAALYAGAKVLVVTHGGVIDVLYRRATGRTQTSPRDFTIPNAAVNWFACERGVWSLVAWNVAPDAAALDDL